ncbi:MAG: NADH-quinone oxidoreductase subunit L [Actinobacteria bacterium]|nr:NADH-quinone oxidoreductase subunit L [Actinomycetota bacterium]
MLWALPLTPLAAGLAIWRTRPPRRERLTLGTAGALALLVTAGIAAWAAWTHPGAGYGWAPGVTLLLGVDDVAGVVALLVPLVAAPIVVYAAAHERRRGLARLVGLLVVFVGAMELLVVAEDLLTLLIGWELVGAVSWGLIAHEWRQADRPRAAAHAFNTTRFGDLGLFLAAMSAFAGAGSLGYADLGGLDGPLLHVTVGGVVLAAAAKSAQVPFSPWLFSAMGGPTPVSALLHAATMVAAGAYILARLHSFLDLVSWFAPVVVGLGLATALAGGVVACLQPHAKKLLAASTSAHYGLMFVAVGAGSTAAGIAHLVTHAAFKSLLFLAAGVAITAGGGELLGRMRLGSRLPVVAALTAVGSLALAGVPPLSGAWTKEVVLAAAGEYAPWLGMLVVAAGGLSAFYAARFQLLAYGPMPGDARDHGPTRGAVEPWALGVLALAVAGLGALWLPGGHELASHLLGEELPTGATWELVASLALVGAGVYAAVNADRGERLATLGLSPRSAGVADWLGLPVLARAAVVGPTLGLCAALARFDDRVVDAGVRGAAGLGGVVSAGLARADDRVVDAGVRGTARLASAVSRLLSTAGELGFDGLVRGLAGGIAATARDSRRLQTGMTHHYYVLVACGLVALVAATAIWR